MLDVICEKLGVEVGERWQTKSGNIYALYEDGTLYNVTQDDSYENTPNYMYTLADTCDYRSLLKGELKPVWKPKEGDTYFTPFIYGLGNTTSTSMVGALSERLYREHTWDGIRVDELWFSRGLVCKTKEDAIKQARDILKFIEMR